MARSTLTRQRLVVVFLIGFLLLFSPVVCLFERPIGWYGIPLLYFYLFGVWALIIAATVWVVGTGEE